MTSDVARCCNRAELPLAQLGDGEDKEVWLELQAPDQDTEVTSVLSQ